MCALSMQCCRTLAEAFTQLQSSFSIVEQCNQSHLLFIATETKTIGKKEDLNKQQCDENSHKNVKNPLENIVAMWLDFFSLA